MTAQENRGRAEIVPALLLALTGVYMIADGHSLRTPPTEGAIGPRFFPYVVGGALIVVGLWLAVAVWRGDRAEAEQGEDVDTQARTDWRTLGTLAAIMLLYVLILDPVGYLLSTVGLFAGTAWTLSARNPRSLVLVSLLVPFVTFLLFTRALGVYLPNGVLQTVI
ncbi:tripartite tricarboxylate transporter TctB family protein [Kineosporia sp. J2-2]|uniref:Tripartite tricarboxylate transporter TctB family protein n=1 Tax=Kineosporia corallincola TaxID=2835133 RepID=A0ABS5TFR8_9ACTN|nr:tripartite tricarboxylate transporter TctB family protein [Kineosporia corallincola]MBT0769942.1 tripartite tricarboxylate transporter TctB family protein [Kineosporia corallincola]